MHHLCVVHGYLKGVRFFLEQNVSILMSLLSTQANILINGDWRACIADFGFSTITDVATHTATGASKASVIPNEMLIWSTHRWMSPELLVPEWFGMPELENNRPTKGCERLGFSDELWEMVGLCWKENRDARPGIEGILSCLNDAVSFWYRRDYH